jgi:hypothetical protein
MDLEVYGYAYLKSLKSYSKPRSVFSHGEGCSEGIEWLSVVPSGKDQQVKAPEEPF